MRMPAVNLVRRAIAAAIVLVLAACDRADVKQDGAGQGAAAPAPDGEARVEASSPVARDAAAAAAAPRGPAPPPTAAEAGSCPTRAAADVGLMVSPEHPVVGEPLTIVAATLDGEAALALRIDGAGDPGADVQVSAGVPAITIARVAAAPAGVLEVVVGRGGTGLVCTRVEPRARARVRVREASVAGVWPVTRAWDGAEEALFSAWVRTLFHAPRGEELARTALHELTADGRRNLLHDHLGWNEDAADTKVGMFLRPDCADTPYFLRAYYAWKRGLPFGFRGCSRGAPGKAPRCGKLRTVVGPPENASDGSKPGELGVVQKYFRRTLAWGVHTGNGRTAFGDDDTDFYPVALTRRGLRPGVIYADPYGHVFVVVELVDPSGDDPGILYAIDGQPDGSITRKRFWEGNFLWNADPGLGGSGFKAFRPLAQVTRGGASEIIAIDDAELASRPGYGDVSDEQRTLEANAFYDRMDALVTPGPRDAARALDEAMLALLEAARVRVTSVDNGEAHFAGGGGVIAMPAGHAIFETTGAWENFATPARDLRLLIAIDLVLGFGDKVRRNAAAFARDGQDMDALVAALERQRDAKAADGSLAFEYTRSDGSRQRLTLAQLIERRAAFEMAYNPNECPELRWGAAAGSAEARTCKRRVPAEQARKMKAYRVWFAERRRPARGDPGPALPP
ncbi:MAG: hypothetical protein KBB21_06075 [Nannocystaceae bacterium]|nr:hypothetical protein [Nannocystaceae bacterium]